MVNSLPEIPIRMREVPCTVGIDEAGRGPVLGPLVYCAFACCDDQLQQLRDTGVADSKTLSPKRRERVFCAFSELRDSVFWSVSIISPAYISASMLKRSKYNLNEISQDSAASLLLRLLEAGINVRNVFVDTVGDAGKFQARLASKFDSLIDFTVCPKADSLYPQVSAASICAKILRDRCVENLCQNLRPESSYVSGYPGKSNRLIRRCR